LLLNRPCTKLVRSLEGHVGRGEQGDELSGPHWNLDDASRTEGEGFGLAKSRAHSLKNFERLGMNAFRGAAGEFLRAALKKGKCDQPADEQGGKTSGQSHHSGKVLLHATEPNRSSGIIGHPSRSYPSILLRLSPERFPVSERNDRPKLVSARRMLSLSGASS
jgi:hypothetical protein